MFSDVHVFVRPCFGGHQTGVAFCRELSSCSGRLGLASCRLLDNRQLRLGKAMKGDEVRQGTYLCAWRVDLSFWCLRGIDIIFPHPLGCYGSGWQGWFVILSSANDDVS